MRLLIILLLTGCTQAVVIQSNAVPIEEARAICEELTGNDDAIGCWTRSGNRHQIWWPEGDYCVAAHEVRHVYEEYWHKGKKYQCAKLQPNP